MRILKTIWWYIKYGKPMRLVRSRFVRDLITNRYRHIYCDSEKNYWMAYSSVDTGRILMTDGAEVVATLQAVSKMSPEEKAGFVSKTMEVLDEAIASICPESE